MQTVVSSPSLSSTTALSSKADTELALIRRFQRGDLRAGDALIRAHAGLVRSIAHGYRLWGVPLEDLVQQGSIGLLKALQRFDAARTQSLQSYAGYWIRAEIREYVVRSYRIVRLGSTRTERKALRTFRVRSIGTPEQLVSGYPATPAGQAANFRDVLSIVRAVPGGLGLGAFYWDATWTAVAGNGWNPADPASGNSWENQAMFDFDDRPLPVMSEFVR